MDKRYQVFISSTYVDLVESRKEIYQVLMEMDCIPAGMELFLSADEEQFSFIKSVIDDSDYYVLVVAGRYGSMDESGVSYTEKEFDYAISTGKHVLAFIHDDTGSLPSKFTEPGEAEREKLVKFISKVSTGRLVTRWNQGKDLPGLVARSLHKAIKVHPAIGWVRANAIASEALLTEFHEIKKENELLKKRVAELDGAQNMMVEGLAGLDEEVDVPYVYYGFGKDRSDVIRISLNDVFMYLSPYVKGGAHVAIVVRCLGEFIGKRTGLRVSVDGDFTRTLLIQFVALGLLEDVSGLYRLTVFGVKKMYEGRTIKASVSSSSDENCHS